MQRKCSHIGLGRPRAAQEIAPRHFPNPLRIPNQNGPGKDVLRLRGPRGTQPNASFPEKSAADGLEHSREGGDMLAKCGAPAVGGNFPEKHAKTTHFQPTPGGVSSAGCTFQNASRINKLCFVQASHRILVLPPPLALTQTTPLRFPFGAGCSLRSRQPQRENARGSFACSPMVGGKTRMRQLVKKPPRPAPGRLPGHSQGGRAAGAAWGAPRPSGWARPRRRATWLCCCAPIHVCGAGGRRAVPMRPR